MGGCFEEELALDLISGRLDEVSLASVDQHLDSCPLCRDLVLALARDAYGGTAPRCSGDRIGRYTLVEPLGRGAFGVVWRAHDERLGRDVALKLLKGTPGDLHLEGEARAMARLAHPNIATVFDAGRFDSGEPFLAMELLEGETLRAWLATEPSQREVLRRLLPVADGLDAAHRAGLVHRDLKPDNILFDAEGRAKVTDFGLAVGALPIAEVETDSLNHSVVLPGRLIGTPAYMSPEQLRGEPATAQSDQFAYCVLMYEALGLNKPFPAQRVDELRARIEKAPARSTRKLPFSTEKALKRGLALRPEDRFSDLRALAIALEPGGEPRRARRWLAIAALAMIGLGAWAWSRSVESLGAGGSEPAHAAVDVELETEAVRALRGELDQLAAVGTPWSPAQILRAHGLVARAKDAKSERLIARGEDLLANAQLELGQVQLAEQAGLRSLGAAQRLGDPRLEANAWLTLAGIAASAGRIGEAERRCRHVENRLASVGDVKLEASLKNTLGVVLTEAGRYPEAKLQLEQAVAMRKQALGPDDPAVARVLTNLGNLARAQGDYQAALRQHELAQKIDERRLGKDHVGIARHLHNRARAHLLLGQTDRGRELYERALAIEKKALGGQHPAVARTLNSLGLLCAAIDELNQAEAFYRAALVASTGDESLEAALARYNLGLLQLRQYQAESALGGFEQASAALERILGPSEVRVVRVQVAMGRALIALNKREGAAFALRRAVKLAMALEVPSPELLNEAQNWLRRAESKSPIASIEQPFVPTASAVPSIVDTAPSAAAPSAAPPAVSAAGSYMADPAFK